MLYWQDIRYAVRTLQKSPWFTALTVAVLGGGLGIAIFTFSFLYTAMVRPLPVEGGGSIVRVQFESDGRTRGVDAADLVAIRSQLTSVDQLGAFVTRELVVGEGDSRQVIAATATEWNLFDLTRTPPARGRALQPSDHDPGAEPVAVLSDWTWRTVFGADPDILDSQVRLNGVPTRVVGIAPPGFGFPVATRAWVPLESELLRGTVANGRLLDVYAKLAPGGTPAALEAELAVVVARVQADRPDRAALPPSLPLVRSFPMAQMGSEGPLFYVILHLLAGMILLLACTNVINLLLARANERVRETAVRLALGAPRGRLIVQSMWETVLLCVVGGVLATGVAALGLTVVNDWAHARLVGNLAFWWVWAPDLTTLAAAGVLVTAVIALLGTVVAGRVTSTRLNAVLQDGTISGGSRREGRVARYLVIGQIATVSSLLFFGLMSGLVASRVVNVDFGYDTERLVQTWVDDRDVPIEARPMFRRSLLDLLEQQSEAEAPVFRADLADMTAPAGKFMIRGQEGARAEDLPRAFVRAVQGAHPTAGVDVLMGRGFDARDSEAGVAVAIVSQAVAAQWWPGRSPIGEEIRLTGLADSLVWRTVVGVARDIPMGNFLARNRSSLAVYLPLEQADAPYPTLAFRHVGGEAAAHAALHRAVTTLDPTRMPASLQGMDDVIEKTTALTRGTAILFGTCFGFAMLLAASGIYGLAAQSIGQRTREIGVRRAVGADDRRILALLLGQSARQLGIGAVLALPLLLGTAWLFARTLPIGLVEGALAAIGVAVAIAGVVLAATWIPARRAVRIEPRDALWQG